MRSLLKRIVCAAFAAVIALAAVCCTKPETAVSADFSEMPVSSYYAPVLYNNTNGLPTSEANTIAADADGAIWIGSYGGLVRYDGSHFERMDSTTGLSSIVSLFFDSKKRMWVGTNDSGAAVIENGTMRKYNREDGLTSLSVRSMTEDKSGRIYIATTSGVAAVGTDMLLRKIDAPQLNEEYVRELKTAEDGTVYGVTKNGAVFTLRDGALGEYYSSNTLNLSDIHAILPDPSAENTVYLATTGNYIVHMQFGEKPVKKSMIHTSPLNYINNISMFGDMLWICADNGIGYVENGAVTVLNDLPMQTSVESMIEDYQGNLWFTSSQQGVMKIVSNHFADLYQRYPDLKNKEEVVYSTCLYHNMLFIGTKTDGLRVLSEKEEVKSLPVERYYDAFGTRAENTDLLTVLGEARIRSIVRDSRDCLWFSTYGETALMRYDGKTLFRFNKRDGLPSDRIRTVYECKDGSMAVAATGGAAIISGDKVTHLYNEHDGIGNVEILTVTEAENGDLILGTDGGGIYVIHEGSVQHYGLEAGLSSEVVMRIKKDVKRSIYWIVTSNSIAYMDAHYEIHTVNQFPYSNNFDLYENSRDEMWILSSNGIYVAKAEDLLSSGELKTDYYGRENGLMRLATANSYSELTADGDLYIAANSGVIKVNIENPLDDFKNVNLSVPYIEVDGKRVYPDKNGVMQIPADAKKLTIYSFVYNYSLISPTVSYRLDGFDESDKTVKQSELQPMDYTNLGGGDYQFVMKLHDSRNHTIKTLSVSLHKKKAFYEQLWVHVLAFVLFLCVIALAVFLYLRYRTAAYRKRETQQKQLLNEIVEAFAKVIDIKDKYTNGHSARVAKYTMMLTRELGYDEETVQRFYHIALLHDIGKIGVPMEVLNKPGKLTDEEFGVIKSHAANGYEILKDISIMPELAIGAGAHHERPDGKGYPKGLKGNEIPRVAQIIAVADCFDAMYSNRPYRKRMNFEKAVSIIRDASGTQLTCDVVDAFLKLVEQGEFRAPDDHGGGTVEDIDNIHKKQQPEQS